MSLHSHKNLSNYQITLNEEPLADEQGVGHDNALPSPNN